jgi:hypothetical protein
MVDVAETGLVINGPTPITRGNERRVLSGPGALLDEFG